MPLLEKVAYSRVVKLPSGFETIALYNTKNEIIDYRACLKDPRTLKFKCPRDKKQRKEIIKKLGL